MSLPAKWGWRHLPVNVRTKSYFCHEAGGEEPCGPIPLNMYIPLLHINNVKQI